MPQRDGTDPMGMGPVTGKNSDFGAGNAAHGLSGSRAGMEKPS